MSNTGNGAFGQSDAPSVRSDTTRDRLKEAEALDAYRRLNAELLRQVHPSLRLPNEDLYFLRPRFPPLFAFHPDGTSAELFEDSGVIREAYESAGTLYFPLDRSPAMGVHSIGFYSFNKVVAQVALSTSNLQGLWFSHMDLTSATLQGFEKSDSRRNDFWILQDGRLRQAHAPGTPAFFRQSENPASCVVSKGAVTFLRPRPRLNVSEKELATATRGISLESGITIGCRRIGTAALIWLTADEDDQDGVTFQVSDNGVTPLFVGHAYIETPHFLVFTQYDNNSELPQKYLFLRSD
ncbi:MAG: hypothetical protein IAI50_17050 [Candidatus Eremiobacteraeota bacterium]|nr:hypothetical protein [Candidatus Eremiobacteraeota bacterium]